MAREFRSFLLITAEKTSGGRDGELFRRYRNALVQSPRQWFRLRDADALVRFSLAAALVCNDCDLSWLTEEKLHTLAEIAITLYDAVAFHKHRAEAELCSTFAYIPQEDRSSAYQLFSHILWSLDVTYGSAEFHIVSNFIRSFGGPIHMMMHRYRFVENGLTIGNSEAGEVAELARRNVKLWFRPNRSAGVVASDRRYRMICVHHRRLLFSGMAEILRRSDDIACLECRKDGYRGTDDGRAFSGVSLCGHCAKVWRDYLKSLPSRLGHAFPEARMQMEELNEAVYRGDGW